MLIKTLKRKLKERNPTWNNRKISYVGVLIAASVVFVLIGSLMFAVTTFPSIKISFAGVTVKITGFMFGPLIGFVTGFLSDIISFLYLPTYYHIGYSLTLSLSGFIPGIIMWWFGRKSYSVNYHFFAALITIGSIMVGLAVAIIYLPEKLFEKKELFIHSRIAYEFIVLIGFVMLLFLTIIFRFKLTKKNFKGMAQIIIFTAILGTINPILVPLWDQSAIGIEYLVGLSLRFMTTTFEMLLNIIILFIAWRVISPQITKNFNNSFDESQHINNKNKIKQKK